MLRKSTCGTTRTWWFLWSILALGLLIRLVHFWAISGTAFPKIPLVFTQSDLYATWQWAQTILTGDWLGHDTYHPYFEWMQSMAPLETWYRWWGGKAIFQQAPLYSYWVAGLLALSHHSLPFVLLTQLVLGAFHPLVMFGLARRVFDERVGLVAAAMTAFYGPFIFHQGTLLRDWLPPLLEPLALLLILRARDTGRGWNWFLAGTVLGMALLTKETILLFLPLALLWIAVEYRTQARQAVTACAVLLLGLSLAFSPLTLRNALVGAPLSAISNRAAEGLIEGNAADARPIGFHVPHSMKGILERSDGRLWQVTQETLRTHQGDWVGFLSFQLWKLRGVADPLEVPNNLDFYYGLEISPALRPTLRYAIIFPLGLAGFLLSLTRWRQQMLLLLYGLSVLAGVTATIILARYRLAFTPVLILYGAAGLAQTYDTLRSRRLAGALLSIGLILSLGVVQQRLVPIPVLRTNPAIMVHGPEYDYSAKIYAEAGQFDRAIAEMVRFRQKVRNSSGSLPSDVRNNSGVLVSRTYVWEGNYHVAWANRLFEERRRPEALRHVVLAQKAYAQEDPSLAFNPEDQERAKLFFEDFHDQDDDPGIATQIKILLQWLKGPL